jgi:hypothetical protein
MVWQLTYPLKLKIFQDGSFVEAEFKALLLSLRVRQ